jgi:hypothetical protein
VAARKVGLNEKPHSCFTLDLRGIEKPAPMAEATVDLLKGDNVGAEGGDDLDDAIRSDDSIRASTLVNIVGCDLHGDLNSLFVIYRASRAAPQRLEASR